MSKAGNVAGGKQYVVIKKFLKSAERRYDVVLFQMGILYNFIVSCSEEINFEGIPL